MIRCAHFTCYACRPTEPERDAEVRSLRAKLAERDAEIEALRAVVASARCTVLAENVSRDDLRRELMILRAALAKVPR